MSTFYAMYPPGSAGSTNASVGVNGAPAPASSTEVGGINPGGNLQPLQTDSSGNLLVSLAAEPGAPLAVNLTEVAGAAISLGQKAPAASLPVVDPSNGVIGSAVPADAAFVGARDPGGLLAPLLATAAGYLGVQDLVAEASLSAIQTHTSNIDTVTADIDSKTPPLGQALMASSVPVAIASDQSAIPVDIQGTVPISGTITANQGTPGVGAWPVLAAQSGTYVVTQATGSNLHVQVDTSALPTGASTSALQSSVQSAPGTPQTVAVTVQGNASGVAIPVSGTISVTGVATSANQTNASQKTQIVDGSGNVISSTTNALDVNIKSATTLATTTNLTQVGGSAITLSQKTSANSFPVVLASDQSSISVTQGAFTASNAPVQNIYSSVNITTAAYTQLIASTTSATKYIDIFDSSGQAMILATGAAASEVILAYIPPGGDSFSFAIPSGTRVAYKALSANATSGYLLLNLRG